MQWSIHLHCSQYFLLFGRIQAYMGSKALRLRARPVLHLTSKVLVQKLMMLLRRQIRTNDCRVSEGILSGSADSCSRMPKACHV